MKKYLYTTTDNYLCVQKSVHVSVNLLIVCRLFNKGDHMNIFLNENWREVLGEIQPAIEEVFGRLFTNIGQQFLNHVPENQIFLD